MCGNVGPPKSVCRSLLLGRGLRLHHALFSSPTFEHWALFPACRLAAANYPGIGDVGGEAGYSFICHGAGSWGPGGCRRPHRPPRTSPPSWSGRPSGRRGGVSGSPPCASSSPRPAPPAVQVWGKRPFWTCRPWQRRVGTSNVRETGVDEGKICPRTNRIGKALVLGVAQRERF